MTEPEPVPAARRAVLVTGASKGIGAACVERLARDGFRVYAGVRSEADGAAAAAAGRGAVVPLLLDVTSGEQVAAAAARIAADNGGCLTALVNNAGVAVAGPLEFLPIEELRRQMEVNFIGQMAVTQACLPLLRRARAAAAADRRTGRILFMSSISGLSALPFTGAYAASKFALEAAADALRLELRPHGIRVVLIEPGVIETPIWDTSLAVAEENLARVSPDVEHFYGDPLNAIRKRAARGMGGLPASRVADTVSRALTARSPRARYLVGRDARARLYIDRVLPTALRDVLIAAALRRL